jgi:hypothetical protein
MEPAEQAAAKTEKKKPIEKNLTKTTPRRVALHSIGSSSQPA